MLKLLRRHASRMRVHSLGNAGAQRRVLLVFESGDEVIGTIRRFAQDEGWEGGTLSGLGAVSGGAFAFWHPATREYEEHPFDEQAEVASLVGNVALGPDGAVRVHAHVVLGMRDGSARAGHLLRGSVHPTLEVQLVESERPLVRETDAATGLPLLR